jgi:uncharacterized protein
MAEQFLHGIETVEIANGIRPIQTAKSSIIGMVGTAPLAEADTKAFVALPGVANAPMTATSKLVGTLGNAIRIRIVNPGTASAALGVVVAGNDIMVNLATSAGSVPTSTAAQVIAAIVASVPANALVAVTNDAGSTGAGLVAATTGWLTLAGGTDEPFPLNVPVLVTSATMAARLGATGTLPDAYAAIYKEGVNTAVFVRVTEGANAAATLVNVLGAETGSTGVWALLVSEAMTGQIPKILAAPGFTATPAASPVSPVTLALISVATRLRACVWANGPGTTEADAYTDRAKFGSERLMIIDPPSKVLDPATGGYVGKPSSARAAGVMSYTDLTEGFWWSPSNRQVNGISGTMRPVTFGLNSRETEANRLNEKGITTIVQKNGFRIWGNRSCATDPRYAFISVRRTADTVIDSIEAAHLWAMDRPFSAQLVRDIRDSVQAYLDTLKSLGAILGGSCQMDPDLNTAATLQAGKLYMNYDFEPPAPLEYLQFRAWRNGSYYDELIADINSTAA